MATIRERFLETIWGSDLFKGKRDEYAHIIHTLGEVYQLGPYAVPAKEVVGVLTESGGLLTQDILSQMQLSNNGLFRRNQMTEYERQRLIDLAYWYWDNNVTILRSVETWTDFSVGNSIAVSVEENEAANKIVADFWMENRNQVVLGETEIINMSLQTLNEGENFFVLWYSPIDIAGTATLDSFRTNDLNIIWEDPKKKRRPAGYYIHGMGDDETWIFADWRFNQERFETDKVIRKQIPTGRKIVRTWEPGNQIGTKAVALWKVWNRHPIICRGVPSFRQTFEWATAFTEFAADRAAVASAAAMITQTFTVDGGSRAVGDAQGRMNSQLGGASRGLTGMDGNPPPAAGSTFVQNKASDLQWQQRISGGGDSRFDARTINAMNSMGTGIPLYSLGIPDSVPGGLATAREIAKPFAQQMARYRKYHKALHADIAKMRLSIENNKTYDLLVINVVTSASADVDTTDVRDSMDAINASMANRSLPQSAARVAIAQLTRLVLVDFVLPTEAYDKAIVEAKNDLEREDEERKQKALLDAQNKASEPSDQDDTPNDVNDTGSDDDEDSVTEKLIGNVLSQWRQGELETESVVSYLLGELEQSWNTVNAMGDEKRS